MEKKMMMLMIVVGLMLFLTPLVQADYTTGLVARWAFNPGSELTDDIGANSSLTNTGGVTFNAAGQAIFDGTSAASLNAGIGAGGELNIAPDITMWMRVNISRQTTFHQFLMDKWGGEWVDRPYQMFVRSEDVFQCKANFEGWDGTQVVRIQSAATVGAYTAYDQMADLTYVWNSNDPTQPGYATMTSYINGIQIGQVRNALQPPASMGVWPNTTQDTMLGEFLGTCEEARIYNQALTAAQVGQIEYVPVPEPITLALLSLGILPLVYRRK